MDHYFDDNDSDDMQAGVPSVGDSRFKNKKSKIWDFYKPVTINGLTHTAECRYCHARYSCKGPGGGNLWQHYRKCRAKDGLDLGLSQQQQNAADIRHVMDHYFDDYDSDDTQAGVPSVGDSRFKNKKSKIWDFYKPVTINGLTHTAECRYCHARYSCKGPGGGNLWRHYRRCRAKDGLGLSQQQQDAADLRHEYASELHKGISCDRTPVDQHIVASPPRDQMDPIEQNTLTSDMVLISENASKFHKGNPGDRTPVEQHIIVASLPTDKMDPIEKNTLKNGMVFILEYARKFHKGSSGDRTPVDQHIAASPPRDKMDPIDQNTSSAQTCPSRKFDQESSYQELTKMISLHGYPLSIVEHEEMRCFAKSLNPAFKMASSIDIEEFSTIVFQERKADLKKKIALSSHRVSLSACLWTPHGSEPLVKYLCLAVHFIDSDWKLEKRIIKFGVFQRSPTSLDRTIHFKEAPALDSESGPFYVILEAIRDWNLDRKLFSLTFVSEIRNDERTSKLTDFLIQWKCFPIGGDLYNTDCLDGVLNSIVSKGQPALNLAGDILERFIQAHMSSSLTQRKLIEVITQTKLKCPEEDGKWWHGIYFGLEVLLHFKKTFPSEEFLPAKETETVESVCKILRAIYHAIEVFSGPVYPTANLYFNELWIVRTTLEEQASTDHTELSIMIWEMQEALDEFWQNSYVWLSVPVVFDPRFKFAFIEFHLKLAFGSEAAKYVSVVHDTIRELYVEYSSSVDKPSVDTSICETCDFQVVGFYSNSLEDSAKHLNVQSQISTELNKYLDDDLVPRNNDFNIMNWWMSNSSKYPTLCIMARDILAVPGSAVHCEAALRSEGPAISKQWSKLNIKTIEALVCIRDWIK